MDEQLFPTKQAPAPPNPVGELGSLAARLKLAEQRYQNLQKRNQLTEESLLQFTRDIRTDLRALTSQVVDMRKRVVEMHQKIDGMAGELSGVVRRHELAQVERYLDLWQPMRFVTREEARRMIAQRE